MVNHQVDMTYGMVLVVRGKLNVCVISHTCSSDNPAESHLTKAVSTRVLEHRLQCCVLSLLAVFL